MSNVVPLGKAAKRVVSDTGARMLMTALEGSVAILNATQYATPEEREAILKKARIDHGKALITNGLAMIRDHDSADAAIEHLIDVLKAMGGSHSSNVEF